MGAAPGPLGRRLRRAWPAGVAMRGDGVLAVVKNLFQYHREHEKYYSEAPRNYGRLGTQPGGLGLSGAAPGGAG